MLEKDKEGESYGKYTGLSGLPGLQSWDPGHCKKQCLSGNYEKQTGRLPWEWPCRCIPGSLRCRAAEIVPDSESGHACGYLRVYRWKAGCWISGWDGCAESSSNSFQNGNRCGCRCTADDSKRKESSFARADGWWSQKGYGSYCCIRWWRNRFKNDHELHWDQRKSYCKAGDDRTCQSGSKKWQYFYNFYGDSGSHLLRCDGSEGSDHGKTGYTSWGSDRDIISICIRSRADRWLYRKIERLFGKFYSDPG